MFDDIRRKNFEAGTLPHLRSLRLISLWLTKNRPEADDLMRKSLNRAFRLWRPSLSKPDYRVLLFKVLTGVFYDGLQKRPGVVSMNYENSINPYSSNGRLASMDKDPANVAQRTIVRLPIEVGYVNFLSKLEGFSPENIADIVGVELNCPELRPEHGFRLLQTEPFTYSGQG
jgi:DNA-directed RNA polymerase specialized sigma24 family protein